MPGKVSIIGAGNVGTAATVALAIDGVPEEIVLFDCNVSKAEGEIMDIQHVSAFIPHTRFTASQDYADIADSDIVVITAGAKQGPGQTRLDLVDANMDILASIMNEVVQEAPNAVIIMVTNPVDILTLFAQRWSGFPVNRVIGTGTILDSARFQSFLAEEFNVSSTNVHAYVMGEHGNSSFPALSSANIGPIELQNMPGYNEKRMLQIHADVVDAAYQVIERTGATKWAIGVCVSRIVRAILNDTHEMYPVSCVLEGEYGLQDVAISTPVVLGKEGIIHKYELPLSKKEKKSLDTSVRVLKEVIHSVEAKEREQGLWCPR